MQLEAAGSPPEWIRFAQADLDLAKVSLPPRTMYSNLCFHAQQAVEKSVKAVLVLTGVEVPNTHNIQRLVELLPPSVERAELLCVAARLTDYAVSSRYPGENEPVLEDEYHEAVRIAELVLSWAEDLVFSHEDTAGT